MTMKNVVFWDLKSQIVPHRKHITSPLQFPACYCYVRFKVFTVVTMKNVVFWDLKTQIVPHRKHINSPLQIPACYCYIRFKVFTAVIMKNGVFGGIMSCGSCKKEYFFAASVGC
jgi:hypothetical protein